jgi:NADP-dependent 3-hydroxy acid dehydrogenase YdfG
VSVVRASAVVTGAGAGLGRAIAHRLADRGYLVAVTDLDPDAAAAVADEIGRERAWSTALQVTDADACRAVAREAAERGTTLEVWVNNAGILRTGPSWELDDAARRLMVDVNLHGTMNGTVAALEHLRPAGRGHVVNIVSLAGLIAAPGEAVYGATKHAALAYGIATQNDLRQAGVKDVHISSLCPDGMWTPMLYDKVDDPSAAASWNGVMLLPEQVAEAAVALLDRPRPVRAVPRWRGAFVRVFDTMPRVAQAALPLALADARSKQRAFARKAAKDPRYARRS